jgi:hypothetical protein
LVKFLIGGGGGGFLHGTGPWRGRGGQEHLDGGCFHGVGEVGEVVGVRKERRRILALEE